MQKHRSPEIVPNLSRGEKTWLVRGKFDEDLGEWVRADKTIHRAKSEKAAKTFVKKLTAGK